MTTRVFLLRHAETDANVEGRSQGWRDVLLNDRGRAQAVLLADRFAGERLAAVVASDATRALDTARPIAERHALSVTVDERLREMHQGDLDGLTDEEMWRDHADFLRRWRDNAVDVRMPGGETLREVQARMRAAFEALAQGYPDASVLVVSHNLASRALLCHALAAPLDVFRRVHVDVASYAEVEVRLDDWWTVNRLNERCHLPSEQRSPSLDVDPAALLPT